MYLHCYGAKYVYLLQNYIAMDKLYEYFYKLINGSTPEFVRYIYSEIDWDSRLIGLTGPRGVGKTTMLLQHIQNHAAKDKTLYVNAEDFYFSDHKLLDLAENFVKRGGKYLYIDEIHKYAEWSKELKLIYDYFSELKLVFTGSSVLDIKKGASDLSRRAVMYHMQGLSFREYLDLFHSIKMRIYSVDEIVSHKVPDSELKLPLVYYNMYLKNGYYPFANDNNFEIRLQQIVNQTLENDIPFYAGMNISTARKLKQLLAIIAKSVPFKPNFSSIATALVASRNNIADYCDFIEDAGMIIQVHSDTGGLRGLGKVDKIYLENPNLVYALASDNANTGNVRETFFLNQMRVKHKVFTPATGDFKVQDFVFEIGGKNKKQKQIIDIPNAFVVKDDIEFGFNNVIPLWHFGLTY